MINKIRFLTLEGKKYPLLMTAFVYEAIEDKYGTIEEGFRVVSQEKKIRPLLDMVHLMMNSAYRYINAAGVVFPFEIADKPIPREDLSVVVGDYGSMEILSKKIIETANAGMGKKINAVPTKHPGSKKKKKKRSAKNTK